MIELPTEADINCSAETIFDLITDFSGQGAWLTRSPAFHGTHDVSENPVGLGTTYREPGPFGVRNGKVVEFERPNRITFHQPMTLKLHAGVIEATVGYVLKPGTGSTHVRRTVTVGIPPSLKLLEPILVGQFRAESARTLLALKAHADKLAKTNNP